MQNAKDSFYVALRSRLTEVNSERTVVVDGVARPAIVVQENETSDPSALDGTFRLQWGGCTAVGGGSHLKKMDCTIHYATRGSGGNGDRGRTLSALDSELMSISQPLRTSKTDYSMIPAKSLGTMVFWTELEFGSPRDEAGRIGREAKTTVYFFSPTLGESEGQG